VKIQVVLTDEPTLYVWCEEEGTYLFYYHPMLHYHNLSKNDSVTGFCLKIPQAKTKTCPGNGVKNEVLCTVLFNNIYFFCKTNIFVSSSSSSSSIGPRRLPPQECTAACRLIVLTPWFESSHLHRQAPPRLQQRERPLAGKGETMDEKMPGNFADNSDFHANVGIFNMPQICVMGQAALLPL
jgi:hypothetical protein